MFFAPEPDLPDRPEVVRMHFTHCPCPFDHTPRTRSRLGDPYPLGQELDETHLRCSRSGARASREKCSRNLGPTSGAAVCLGVGSTVVDGDAS